MSDRRLLARLVVVLLFEDFLALLIELLMQVLALVARQRAVFLVRVHEVANVAPPGGTLLRFAVRQLPWLHALLGARGLVRLAVVRAGVARCCRRTVLLVVLLAV